MVGFSKLRLFCLIIIAAQLLLWYYFSYTTYCLPSSWKFGLKSIILPCMVWKVINEFQRRSKSHGFLLLRSPHHLGVGGRLTSNSNQLSKWLRGIGFLCKSNQQFLTSITNLCVSASPYIAIVSLILWHTFLHQSVFHGMSSIINFWRHS